LLAAAADALVGVLADAVPDDVAEDGNDADGEDAVPGEVAGVDEPASWWLDVHAVSTKPADSTSARAAISRRVMVPSLPSRCGNVCTMRYRLCFVCMGNICRSPMAEAVMRSMLLDAGLDADVEVCSAGTGAWHVGESADARAVSALTRGGYDASAHRARQFTRDWFADHDLVLAVDRSTLTSLQQIAPPEEREKIRLLREFDPEAAGDLDVPDPYYGGRRGFDDVLAMVARSCRGLLEHLREVVSA
jgi:protein-tyrosine phosphatase